MADFGAWVRRTVKAARGVFMDGMPRFDVDRERINVFPVDDQYFFKQYFEGDEVFGELRQYYNREKYRFEVPDDTFDEVRDLLEEEFYELTVVEDPEPFCVVHRKYTEHPDLLFRNAVVQRSQGEHNVFLLKDELAVEQAVNHGTTPLANVDLDVTF